MFHPTHVVLLPKGLNMIPDVLGLPLAEARARLQAAAVEPVIEIHTRPPRNPVCGETRVLRQRLLESGIELTIAEFPILSLHQT